MKKIVSAVAVASASLVSSVAMAQTAPASAAPDVSSLSSAVDYSTVGPAILAAGALGLTIKLAMVAVKYVRRVVGGA
jgi:hypothetical protein